MFAQSSTSNWKFKVILVVLIAYYWVSQNPPLIVEKSVMVQCAFYHQLNTSFKCHGVLFQSVPYRLDIFLAEWDFLALIGDVSVKS